MRQQQQTNPIVSVATAALLLAVAYLVFTIAQQQQGGAVIVLPQQPQTAVNQPPPQTAVNPQPLTGQPLGGIVGGNDANVGGGVGIVPTVTNGWAWAENMPEAVKESIIDFHTDELPVGIAAPTAAAAGDCNGNDAPLFCVSRAGNNP